MSVSAVRAVASRKTWWAALLVALALTGALAPRAGAVLVHIGQGRVAGVLPVRGVTAASIPGSFARHNASPSTHPPDTGALTYGNGPVLHAETPYLIFWDPTNQITSTQKSLLEQYFADTAAASGGATNIFGVDRQYTDTSGFADYNQTWAARHAMTDTRAYPTTGQCSENTGLYSETACLYDQQIQDEVTRLVAADGLPTGTTGSAPIYFVVTPPTVNTCFSDNTTCADNFYCAYHSDFTGANNSTVLYANMPMLFAANDPKGCQADTNAAVQAPNHNQITDVVTSSMSHEFSETITDAVAGSGWVDPVSGNEDGDECAFTGAFDPYAGYNPNAFLPVLGGSSTGTLYDQVINGGHYYTQTEWSNGNTTCEAQPTTSAITAAFSGPSTATPGTSVTFNPSSSTSAAAYTSASWSFGDGATSFSRSSSAPASVSHTFGPLQAAFSAPAGPLVNTSVSLDASSSSSSASDNVTLTLADVYGNVSKVPHSISVSNAGGPITTYAWTFGDGTSAGPSASPTANHTYTTFGQKTVSLTVTNGTYSNTVAHVTTVDAPPNAAFTAASPPPVVGSPTSFDASASGETAGLISSYSWSFGDGANGTGPTPSHTYSAAGPYTVTLTVTDQDGHTATTTRNVNVGYSPSAAFNVTTGAPVAGSAVGFDGSGSSETGGSIVSYSWDFGDGTGATGASATHSYAQAGTYSVVLTVTDQDGRTAQVSQSVTVAPQPSAAFSVTTPSPTAGSPVAFDGSGSSESGGSLVSYSWNFGDGSRAGSGSALTHTYPSAGVYTVVLTVTDANGRTASASHTVTVATRATPPATGGLPSASITVTTAHPIAGGAVAFSGSGSSDRGSTLVAYNWSFGDGSSATGVSSSHSYAHPGRYAVTLTVRDATGASATATQRVTIGSAAITGVKIKKGKAIERLTVAVSGPGSLTLGELKVKVRRAGAVVIKVRLNAAQRHRVTSHHYSVVIRLTLRFAPKVGRASRRAVKFSV
jgi:PKD repeat protein